MSFESYLNQAWADHAADSVKVANEFSNGASLVESNDQISQFAGLVTHVMGEHLGQWENGLSLLKDLQKHPKFLAGTESERAVRRSLQVLKVGKGQTEELSEFSNSDQIRIMATAASALSDRDPVRAKELLINSLELAQSVSDHKDPANRALAITGNNLACALEEKLNRSQSETELMILAAQTGRKFWELAGTWVEISRAEYRLAMSFLQAGDLVNADLHAQSCIEICQENKAGDLDMFYCFEALALVERAKQNEVGFQKALARAQSYFEKQSPDDQSWAEKSLKKLLN